MDMDPAERGGVEWVSEFCPVKGSIRHPLTRHVPRAVEARGVSQWGNSCSWVAKTPIFNSKYGLRDLVAWINKCLG